MIRKLENASEEQLKYIKCLVGEAFVTNELFHNWGSVDERRDCVMKYMDYYVEFVYRSGSLYVNDDLTGFIGLEDSSDTSKLPQINMLLKMMIHIDQTHIKSLMAFVKQISKSNEKYAKQRHLDALMVCVDKKCQGKGVATELVEFAKSRADELGVPLLFDTDMKSYSDMYQHFGCKLYNTVTADNGVTRYSLAYNA